MLLDQIIAKTEALGLPTNLLDRRSVPVGNCVTQFQVTESRAGRLVRQLENYYKIVNRTGTLGARFKRIPV